MKTAMPNAPPRNRSVLKVPEALPMCWGATAAMTALLTGGNRHGEAGAEDDQRRDERAVRDGRFGDQRDRGEPGGGQQQADDDQWTLAGAVDSRAGDRGYQEEHGGGRQHAQTGLERAVALSHLQETARRRRQIRTATRTSRSRPRCRRGTRACPNSRIGSSGVGARRHQLMKSTVNAAPPASEATISGLSQPAVLPRTRPQTIPKAAAVTSADAARIDGAGWAEGLVEAGERERDRRGRDWHVEPEDPLPGDAFGDNAADHRAAQSTWACSTSTTSPSRASRAPTS
jgi:hypothetical protein